GTPRPTAGVKEAVQSDLKTAGHDIPIPLNQRVLSYVELFQGRLHDYIEEGMRRGSQYLPMIQNVFRAEGLPLDLAYVPLIESAFKPNALSRVKAKGVWQFMRGTALDNGLRSRHHGPDRSWATVPRWRLLRQRRCHVGRGRGPRHSARRQRKHLQPSARAGGSTGFGTGRDPHPAEGAAQSASSW